MSEREKDIELITTCNYGTVQESRWYDMKDIVGDSLLDHRILKIRCFVKPNKSIYGIQFIYRNIYNCKETTFIDVKSNENDLLEQEMNFNNEDIKDLRVWLDGDVKLIGFEVTTNKNRVKKFGYGNDEQLITISDFKEGDKIIVGFGCCADNKDGITSLYGYYVSRKKYIGVIYNGLLSLKIKIKDTQYKEKIEKKLKKMDEKNKILYRVAGLPDNQFFNIIKYSID